MQEGPGGHVLGICSFSLSSWAWILSSSCRRSLARTTWRELEMGRALSGVGLCPSQPSQLRVPAEPWARLSQQLGKHKCLPYRGAEFAGGQARLALHQPVVLFPQSHGSWEGHHQGDPGPRQFSPTGWALGS